MDTDLTLMVVMLYVGLFTVPPIVVGTLFALPALIPPVRRAMQKTPAASSALMVGGGVVAFVVTHVALAWAMIVVSFAVLSPCGGPCPANSMEARQQAYISKELVLRQILPVPTPYLCYTTHERCLETDWYMTHLRDGKPGRPMYPANVPFTVGPGAGAAVVCAFLVWWITRPPRKQAG